MQIPSLFRIIYCFIYKIPLLFRIVYCFICNILQARLCGGGGHGSGGTEPPNPSPTDQGAMPPKLDAVSNIPPSLHIITFSFSFSVRRGEPNDESLYNLFQKMPRILFIAKHTHTPRIALTHATIRLQLNPDFDRGFPRSTCSSV